MKILFLFFLLISYSGFGQKKIELDIFVTDKNNQPLTGITVEFRDTKNTLLSSIKTDERGKSSFSVPASQTVLIMVFDDDLKYHPENDYYSKRNGYSTFNFWMKDISSLVESYKKTNLALKNDSTVYEVLTGCSVSTDADFQGGSIGLSKFLQENLSYPEFALENGISGRVYARFLIEKNGEITNIRIIRGMDGCKECELEVLRVFSILPAMIPASCEGKNVHSYYNIPIKFTAK